MYDTSMSRDAREDEFHLRFDAIKAEQAGNGAPISFNIILESSKSPDIALSGLSGVLLDTNKLIGTTACVTIFDALQRHTMPKRVQVVSGQDARRDLDGGTDGRVISTCRFVMFCWLPEIYEVDQQGVGTRLLKSLYDFLLIDDVHVYLDLGTDDEKEGFVKIFYPNLDEVGLESSETGRFAQGRWRSQDAKRRKIDIGVVHL